jgi:hypothetical protein
MKKYICTRNELMYTYNVFPEAEKALDHLFPEFSTSTENESKKSPIRQRIEQILGSEAGFCFIDNRKNGVIRMKLGYNGITPTQKEKIKKLPHVIKVGYTESKDKGHYSTYSGVTIHFDCSTKLIEL